MFIFANVPFNLMILKYKVKSAIQFEKFLNKITYVF